LGETVKESSYRVKKLAWMLPTLLLLLAMIAGGTALYTTQAAASGPLTGRYALRAVTTTGPQSGRYITGVLAITSDASGSISGIACGMNYAASRCLTITGQTLDDVNVSLTIANSHSPKFPAVSLSGAFQQSTQAKGSFTGFTGTVSYGTGAGVSTGRWEAINGPVPPATGSWKTYIIVQAGNDRGMEFHGVMNLMQDPNTGAIVGTYTPTGKEALPVSGSNQSGFIFLDLGKPAVFVLKGTFTTPGTGSAGRLSGQFYGPYTGSGVLNGRGYWVANQ